MKKHRKIEYIFFLVVVLFISYLFLSLAWKDNFSSYFGKIGRQMRVIQPRVCEENDVRDSFLQESSQEKVKNSFATVLKDCPKLYTELSGRLETFIYQKDNEDSAKYTLVVDDGRRFQLYPISPFTSLLLSGTKVRVRGILTFPYIFIDNESSREFEIVEMPQEKVFGDQSTLVLFAEFQDQNLDYETAEVRVRGDMRVMDLFYSQNSYGHINLVDPYNDNQAAFVTSNVIPMKANCSLPAITEAVMRAANEEYENLDFQKFPRLIVMAGFQSSHETPFFTNSFQVDNRCDWNAVATLGKISLLTPDGVADMSVSWIKNIPVAKIDQQEEKSDCSWVDASTIGKELIHTPDGNVAMSVTWLDDEIEIFADSLIHGLGHNLGLPDAGILACLEAQGSTLPDTLLAMDDACAIYEDAEDPYTFMGFESMEGHFNSVEKNTLGWFDPSNSATVPAAIGKYKYVLEPIETSTSGLKFIRIDRGIDPDIFIMYRQPIGYDRGLRISDPFDGAQVHFATVLYGSLLYVYLPLEGVDYTPLKEDKSVNISMNESQRVRITVMDNRNYQNDPTQSRLHLELEVYPQEENTKSVLPINGERFIDNLSSDRQIFHGENSDIFDLSQIPPVFGEQKTLFLLVNFRDRTLYYDDAYPRIAMRWADEYYRENSYNKMSFSGVLDQDQPADFPGTYDLPINSTCSRELVTQQALEAAKEDVDFTQYSRLIIMAPLTADDDYYDPGPYTLRHSFGYNLGLLQANLLDCGDKPVPENSSDVGNCVIRNLQDIYTIMGGWERGGHLNPLEMNRVGWLDFFDPSWHIILPEEVGTYTYTFEPLLVSSEHFPDRVKLVEIKRDEEYDLLITFRERFSFDRLLNVGDPFEGARIHMRVPERSGESILIDPTPPTDVLRSSLHIGESLDTFYNTQRGLRVRITTLDLIHDQENLRNSTLTVQFQVYKDGE